MTREVNFEPPLPNHVRVLTLEIAKSYLVKNQWTTTEAVLIFSGLDPRNAPFFDADDANEFWIARLIWHAVRNFRPSNKPLSVDAWIDWAVNGTAASPRTVPMAYGAELQAALSRNFLPLNNVIDSIGAGNPRKALSEINRSNKAPPDWIAVARAYGQQFIDKQAKSGSFPNQLAVGDHVAKRFVDEGLTTDLSKPPSGSYVKRHALVGLRANKK